MEILMIIIGVLAIVSMIAFLVHLFIKAINKDQQEQDERILQLEKRLEEYKKANKYTIDDYVSMFVGQLGNLLQRVEVLEKQVNKLKKKSDKND